MRLAIATTLIALLAACSPRVDPEQEAKAVEAFATVEKVFQHPRCSNCHIPGDQPLQFDTQQPHMMGVVRGPKGEGAVGLPCASCHGEANLPASYGPHAPPGAPHWALPPPDQKMAWIGVPTAELCAMIKDRKRNGDRDLDAMFKHVAEDKLVLWGWAPGGNRVPVPVPHDQFVAAFRTWMDGGAPCPQAPARS
jgi:mono/diheme cytochrome c family protein